MTLTKWDADLIDGLDELDVGVDVDGDYLPLEGGTLTGELTVDANLILEGAITEGQSALEKHSEDDFEIDDYSFPEKQYILSPSQGTMQHLTAGKECTRFILESDQIPQSQSDQDYFFEDGQSMTIRLEVYDLDKPLGDRYPLMTTWPEDIWWVNTKDGLAPDVNKTGAITVNLWKAKGVLYGQLAGDFVKQPEIEYHPNAFDMSKLKWANKAQQWRPLSEYYAPAGTGSTSHVSGSKAEGPPESRIYGPDPELKDTEYDWPLFVHSPQPSGNPTHGITQRGGMTFTRTSRDGYHYFVGQTGSEDNPSELRTFTNSLPSEMVDLITWKYDSGENRGNPKLKPGWRRSPAVPTPVEIPFRFHCGSRDTMSTSRDAPVITRDDTVEMMYREPPKLLGTAVDMRLRVEKGSGMDFNPDGTRMFQSVSNYLDPSLKDKYENVIGVHHLSRPWDVGKTDFLIKEELNDIIYCDEKYSEVRALHPDMRVCGLTFRPDGKGFYFAYVVYEVSKNLQYYFVQQDLEVPWELSSAKDDYKYSKLFTHEKFVDWINRTPPEEENRWTEIMETWHINCITVSQNGRFMHVGFPHCVWDPHWWVYTEKPRQFEMTTPWDISTSDLSWIGVGPTLDSGTSAGKNNMATTEDGGMAGAYNGALTHGIHWNSSGTTCYVSMVPETNSEGSEFNGGTGFVGNGVGVPISRTCHYFNQKAWEIRL